MLCFCAQMASVWEMPEESLEKAERCVGRAAREGGELVCFPEQFATGWDPASQAHVQDENGLIVTRLQEMARRYGIAILGSYREQAHPLPRNTAVAISAQGEVMARYAKSHLFSPASEDRYFSPGGALATFGAGGISIGIAICYDLRFASLFRLYADAGVTAVLVPAAWPESRREHWELFIRARAVEYQMYVVGINTAGTTPVDRYAGGSMAVDPAGNVVCRAGRRESLLGCRLDPVQVERVRSAFPVARDRRDDLAAP